MGFVLDLFCFLPIGRPITEEPATGSALGFDSVPYLRVVPQRSIEPASAIRRSVVHSAGLMVEWSDWSPIRLATSPAIPAAGPSV